MRGGGEELRELLMSTAVPRAQINFGELAPYLPYVLSSHHFLPPEQKESEKSIGYVVSVHITLVGGRFTVHKNYFTMWCTDDHTISMPVQFYRKLQLAREKKERKWGREQVVIAAHVSFGGKGVMSDMR
jgi:hypothetical protein